MNKKLVAVAVAGVLAAPLAAQAQTANVTLYGRLNLDYELVNGRQVDGSNPNVSRLSANSSRVGFRGVESLGGGLNAIFQIESDVRGDTNQTAGWSSRETFVGLQGAWGTFKMGNFLAPYDDNHAIFGDVPTYLTSILATSALWGNNGAGNKQQGSFDARLGNSLRYDSPVWSGFRFSGQVSLRDSSGTTGGNTGDHTEEVRHAYVGSLGAFYTNGPIQIGTGSEWNVKVRGPNLNDWAGTITGAYNFGIVRPALVYQRTDYDTPTGSLTQNLWGVTITAPIGPGALYASWIQAGKGGGSSVQGERVGGVTRGSETASDQWTISYTYPLSKRTQVYAGYVKIANDRNAAYSFAVNSYQINTTCTGNGSVIDQNCGSNGKPGGLVLGMIHFF
jgi:predicted porin